MNSFTKLGMYKVADLPVGSVFTEMACGIMFTKTDEVRDDGEVPVAKIDNGAETTMAGNEEVQFRWATTEECPRTGSAVQPLNS